MASSDQKLSEITDGRLALARVEVVESTSYTGRPRCKENMCKYGLGILVWMWPQLLSVRPAVQRPAGEPLVPNICTSKESSGHSFF